MLACALLRRMLVALLGCALALIGWLLLTPANPRRGRQPLLCGRHFGSGGAVTVRNTIVAANSAPNGAEFFLNRGNANITRNIIGGDPLLGSLANNGGPTKTMLPLTGSPVIGDGDPSICNQTGVGQVNGLDQRGFARPTTPCALGAAEPVLSRISPASGARRAEGQ